MRIVWIDPNFFHLYPNSIQTRGVVHFCQNTFFSTLEPLRKSALHHTRISPTVAIESYESYQSENYQFDLKQMSLIDRPGFSTITRTNLSPNSYPTIDGPMGKSWSKGDCVVYSPHMVSLRYYTDHQIIIIIGASSWHGGEGQRGLQISSRRGKVQIIFNMKKKMFFYK